MGAYNEEINNMTFSFSRCHSFEGCKYEWYLNYLLVDEDHKPIYEHQQNFYAAFGKLCHEILEQILTKNIPEEEGLITYENGFVEISEDFSYEIAEPTMDRYYQYGHDYFEDMSFDWLKDYEILGVEKKCQFEIDGIKFVGYIDLLIRSKETGKIIVIDHKSAQYPIGKRGKVLKNKEEDYEAYKRQLYLYSKQVYEEYGEYPAYLVWNYFRDKKWLHIPFDKKEYDDSLLWAKNIVKNIKDEENFSPCINHFYCTYLCGFRDSCEYKELEDEDD